MAVRSDDIDKDRQFFRSPQRICRVNELWYFASREGDQGPYRSEGEVRSELDRYVTAASDLAAMGIDRNTIVLEDVNFDRRVWLASEKTIRFDEFLEIQAS